MSSGNTDIQFGIVGCGAIASVHAEVLGRLDGGRLASVYSRNSERREAFASDFGAEAFGNYEAFLANRSLDAVVLCTPNGTHLDYGIPAADAGKDLIIEKPLEVTVERGRRLLDHCLQAGVRLTVIYQNRFIPAIQELKQTVDQGLIGDLVMVRGSVKWFRDQDYYQKAPWRGTLDLDGGGALINQAIHTVDLITWLAGPVASVQAFKGTLTHEGMEGEDNLVASMQFENGALGVFEASTSVTPAQNRMIELHGTRGTAVLDGDDLRITTGNGELSPSQEGQERVTDSGNKPKQPGSGGGASPFAGFSGEYHLRQYRHIVEYMQSGHTPMVSGEESLISLAFVEAAYRSSEKGESVFPEKPGKGSSKPNGSVTGNR